MVRDFGAIECALKERLLLVAVGPSPQQVDEAS
jgi:hypothetical protein